MARRKESGSAPGDIQAQIISGRDGKPAYAVLPVEAFLTLATLACESVQGSRKTVRQTQMHKSLEANVKKQMRALQKHIAEVSDLLSSGQNTAAHSAVDGEEDEDVAAYDAARARDEESFPEEVAARLIAGENPVKVFRTYREWTQQELAENIGTTAPYLSQIETGRRTGSVKLLHRLADALQVELDDLV